MSPKTIQNLEIWQMSMDLCADIYNIFTPQTLKNDYNLMNQIQRSAISIPSNITEGFERNSDREFARFLKIAKGSLGELKTQIIISTRIGYLSDSETSDILKRINTLGKKIGSLINYLYQVQN